MMSEWRPIETAPRDGRLLMLACVGKWTGVGRVTASVVQGNSWFQGGVDVIAWEPSNRDVRDTPTHWMPLPAPPTPSVQETDDGRE